MFEWLKDWDNVHIKGIKKPIAQQNNKFNQGRMFQDAQKLNAKAAMLSGPPGIGKTSSCRIICSSLGYEVLEMNASDCRNKLSIEQGIATLAKNKSINYFTVSGI